MIVLQETSTRLRLKMVLSVVGEVDSIRDFSTEPLSPEVPPGSDATIVVTDLGNGFHRG